MKQSEHDITKAIRQVLKVLGIFHWKVHQGLGCTPGVPDILGIWQGKLLGIEIKTAAGKVSDHQAKFIARINQEGGIAFVARSVEDVIEHLGVGHRFIQPSQSPHRPSDTTTHANP